MDNTKRRIPAPVRPRSFTITLELGNDAMQTPRHVAAALIAVAARLRTHGFGQQCAGGYCTESVMDINGNRVGSYKAGDL